MMDNNTGVVTPTSEPRNSHSWARRIRLTANPLVNTAGLLEWACIGFRTEKARGGHLAPFLAVLADGYKLGIVLAERVLRGEIMTLVEGEEVVLLLDAESARIFDAVQRTAREDAEHGMYSRDLPVDVDREVDGQQDDSAERVERFCSEGPQERSTPKP